MQTGRVNLKAANSLATLKRADRAIDRESGDHISDDRLTPGHKLNCANDLRLGGESGDHLRAMIA
jgi:hypothetical protein